jgi:type II secretion system protein N
MDSVIPDLQSVIPVKTGIQEFISPFCKRGSGDLKIKKISILLLILFLCVWGVWFAITESFIIQQIKNAAGSRDVKIELTGLQKGLFFTIHIERVIISTQSQKNIALASPLPSSPTMEEDRQSTPPPSVGEDKGQGGLLLTMHNADMVPDLLSLLKLAPQVNINGQVNFGTIRGTIFMKQPNPDLDIVGENIQINGLPIIERTGIYGDGSLKFTFQRTEERGEITFSIDNAKLKGALTGLGVLPLGVFKSVRGLLTIGDTVNVDSLAFEGKGIYTRIKGKIIESRFDGNIEMMIDSSFELHTVVESFLERYKISAGYYVIPYTQKI